MSKKPIIITCQPDDDFFIWQNHLYIESCLNVGFEEEQIHLLLYTPPWREVNKKWESLKNYYPNLNIFYYGDYEKGCSKFLGLYIPILRPHILKQHFLKFPELEKEIIIYTDCDILWTKTPDIEKYYNNDSCYISDAHSYLNADYFKSKEKDVLPEKLERYKKGDVLKDVCSIVGITKETAELNNLNTGGVQYLLKNMNYSFWDKVEKDIIFIRTYLMNINKEFFESENKGFQSWCADLWAVNYNLWYNNQETKVVPELEFAWSSDQIDKLNKSNISILHNAGIVSEKQGETPVFYKGKYHIGTSPFTDPYLELLYNNEDSKKLCNWYYVSELIKLKNKFNLDKNGY